MKKDYFLALSMLEGIRLEDFFTDNPDFYLGSIKIFIFTFYIDASLPIVWNY